MARGQSDADFERVNALVAGGMKKMQAFAVVAKERGISANGVRVNYYNASRRAGSPIAKSGGVASRGSARRRSPRRRAGPQVEAMPAAPTDGAGNIDALAGRLVASVQALSAAVQVQNRELEDLRRRVDQARAALR